jgi:lysozyme
MTEINPLVADLSHHNWDRSGSIDFAAAKASGLVGVILKATEGATYRDPRFTAALTQARQAGLLCGAYHFGTAADTDAQFVNFTKTIGDTDNLLLVLDFEANEANLANSMASDQAIDFLARLATKSGRRPTIYTGSRMYDLFGKRPQAAFAPYRVWWAQYGDTIEVHPTWPQAWLWQYTDGFHGPKPHQIPGLGFGDINSFDGTPAQLTASWLA